MTGENRFDDLRPGRQRSFTMQGLVRTVEARSPSEIGALFDEVEAATAGGLWSAGFLAYEAAPGLNPLLSVAGGRTEPPCGWFGLYEEMTAGGAVDEIAGDYRLGDWEPSVDRDLYVATVERIRRNIRAGDTYQVNYTFRLDAPFAGSGLALYRDLALSQSGGYNAFLDTGDRLIISASPELFFEWDGRTIVTRPMKGTTARGRFEQEDEERRAALVESEKDRAENVMIVDLIRNDLGRISEFGSVEAVSLFEAERYSTVWQLTSTVRSQTRPGTSLADVFVALFPSGSVTGAPKRSTMEIITETEAVPRGVYCGAIGFVAPYETPGPRAVFNVAIRTVEVDTATNVARYGVGGGITYGSTALGEFDEARLKARILWAPPPQFELLETLRWDPEDGWWWLDEHLARLSRSATYFGIPLDVNLVRKSLLAAAGGGHALRVRLTVGRSGREAVSIAHAGPAGQTVTVGVDDVPVDVSDPFVFHKTTQRIAYEAAKARHPGCEDVLLMNDRREMTESTVANVVVKLDGRWVTPPVEVGCLPGVHREVLLRSGELAEAVVTLDDLERAEGVALINSVRGWMPAEVLPESAISAVS